MSAKKWTILIIGDKFVRNDLLKAAFDLHMRDIKDEIHYKFLDNIWPDVVHVDVEDVHEAVGDVDAIVREAGDVDIIVTDVGPIGKRVIDAAPRLKLIAVTRGGPVNVNLKEAEKRGVTVVNLPGRNAKAVAEFTLALILALVKRIPECHAGMLQGVWRSDYYLYDKAPEELEGQVAGLIGFGIIGQLVCPMLKAFGMTVIASDPYADPRIMEKHQVESVDLDRLLNRSDVVSIHARVTKETAGMMGAEQFKKMKPTAYFINTARGPLVDYPALSRALKEGWIAGAALDTYDVEPLEPGNPLLELPNVVLTPHIAGSSKQTASGCADRIAREALRFIKNEPLLHVVRSSK